MNGRFDDLRTGASWQFGAPQRIVSTHDHREVHAALVEVDQATRAGHWAHGFVSYEAGAGGRSDHPLVWFAITDAPHTAPTPLQDPQPYRIEPWQWDWTEADHADRVARVHAAIAAGDTYQTNLTTRLRSTFRGDARTWYDDLGQRQRGGFHALVDTGDHTIVSASPECFLCWQGDRLSVVPMKGTAPRDPDPRLDERHRRHLLDSAKERAENVMIVDLVRNDLSRIALPGTVRVDELLATERYDTLWQLTSTVSAQIPADTPIPTIFDALFPCGSITGAPKQRTMELIRELEDSPRGIYCGAIGWIAPPTEPVRARFGIAIRTAVIDKATGTTAYGVGGGITWDSTAPDEWAELHTKAQVVADTSFDLIETLAVRAGRLAHRDLHRARLMRSATAFDIPFPQQEWDDQTTEAAGGQDRIVRFALATDGGLTRTERPLPPAAEQARLAVDTVATPDSLWRRHKTSRRRFCDEAKARHAAADDVILVTADGLVTETTIANLAVRLDNLWCTPPLSDGLLPGIGREVALAEGRLVERSVTVDDLFRATAVATISSVRGWRPAVLVSATHGLS